MKILAAISILVLLCVCEPAFAQGSGTALPGPVPMEDGVKITGPKAVNEIVPSATIRPVSTPQTPHKFLDLKNSLGIGAFGFALAADSYSTQRGLAYPGVHEANPLARPFVASRGGQVAYSSAGFALFAGGMYVVHRTGHHKVERFAPWIAAGWEAVLAGWNMHEVTLARQSR
jgi:hypothetical protein